MTAAHLQCSPPKPEDWLGGPLLQGLYLDSGHSEIWLMPSKPYMHPVKPPAKLSLLLKSLGTPSARQDKALGGLGGSPKPSERHGIA